MKKVLILLLLLSNLSSCKKEEELFCGSVNPLKELSWLNEIKKSARFNSENVTTIEKVIYKGNEGFLVSSWETSPDSPLYLQNCEGEIICTVGGVHGQNDCPDLLDSITYREVLWTNK